MALPLAVQGWQLQCGEVQPDCILDLRQPDFFRRGHLPGARNLPYERFQAEALHAVQGARAVLVVDPGGARAAEMATWLRARGVPAAFLEGGLAAWTGALERP